MISLGLPIPPEISQIIADYEKDIESSATPIYDTLKRHSKFPVTKEKEECVVGTVNDLLSDEQDAANPGLLLGKIQCGKTDTFENIIGLSFDRGIDICVVLTKGTKALVDQTIKRMRYDYRFFKESDTNGTPTIFVEDIMENRNVNPAKRNVLNLKNETCKNREKRNVLKISHTRHFKTTKKQSKTGCFYSF